MEFDALLKLMVQKNSSDLFITAGVPPSMKVHGKLSPVTKESLTPAQARDICMGIMNDKQKEEFERTHECNFAISASGIGRFRVSAFQQRNHVGMVLRKIETRIPKLEELSLPPIIKNLAMTKRGLIIFVGGTGTGKSTSLAAMIGYRNHNSTGHIITIEDPIEFVHQHASCIVTQREVGIDTESFDSALKNTLRQAPDVILIGEIRTRETMDHAIAFAETGHLCLATLHANNANQALDRVINFFPEDRRDQLLMDLSLNLKAIVAQQLLPTPDGKARVPAIEVMINTPLAADFIRKGEIHELKGLMKKSTQQGMQTFDQALYDLYKRGKVTYDDALRSADSANELRLMIKLGDENVAGKLEEEAAGLSLVEDQEDSGMLR
jgi:twitching motility protein PilU